MKRFVQIVNVGLAIVRFDIVGSTMQSIRTYRIHQQ